MRNICKHIKSQLGNAGLIRDFPCLSKKFVNIPDLLVLYVCKNSVVTDRILIVVNLAVKKASNTYSMFM